MARATDDPRYGYTTVSENRPGGLVTFESRHDAAAFAALWERETGEESWVEAQARWDDKELATLDKPHPAAEAAVGA